MIDIKTVKENKREKRFLEYFNSNEYLFLFLPLGILLVIYYLISWIFTINSSMIYFYISFFYFVIVTSFYIRVIRKNMKRDDESDGEIEIIKVQTDVSIISNHPDDDRPFYIFDYGEDQSLFLSGQWLYDSNTFTGKDIDDFPSNHFIVYKDKSTEEVIKIENKGKCMKTDKFMSLKDLPFKPESSCQIF